MASTAEKSPAKKSSKAAATPKADKPRHKKRVLSGVVVSDKMAKTIVVKVDRQVKHHLYKKYLVRSKKFKAHDENNDAKTGDLVSIEESRPLSKTKRWTFKEVLRKSSRIGSLKEV